MSEKYLKWLMLREIIGEYLSNFRSEEVDSMKLFFCGKEYNVERLRADYIRLTKELLKDYEVPTPKQDVPENKIIKIGGAKIYFEDSKSPDKSS